MKKATVLMTSALTALLCVTTLSMPKSAYAAESNDLTKYYDLNNDGEFSVFDAVLANHLLENGRFSKQDFLYVCNLIVGNEVNIGFEEFDIDEMDTSDIRKIESTVSSYCVGYDFDGITVTYSYLNDGVVTKMHCSDIGIVDTAIAIPVYDNVRNLIGISPEGKFAIDARKFWDILPHASLATAPLPNGFNAYEVWNLDEVHPSTAKCLLYTSGMYENFDTITTPQYDFVQIWFNNGITVTELSLNRIAPIVKELRSFVYDGEQITIGVTADGKVAADISSFDIAE
ncbi:MAG: hypothetical protein IKF38_04455 [Clostridia bacterium]|nr:hypothetical protein [Clostridia bacterium]